jgi:hypothetical protein
LREKDSVLKNAYRLFLDAKYLHLQKDQSDADIEFLKEIDKYVVVDL